MKTIAALILLCLATLTAAAQIEPTWKVCRNPVRVFKPRTTVNLEPLFQWWNRQPIPTNAANYTSASIDINSNTPAEADRPLLAWHLVTGTHVADVNGGGWAVDAVIYTSPTVRTNARIILFNPPAVEEQNYLALKAQLAQVDQQIEAVQRKFEANTNVELRAEALANAYRRSVTKVASTGVAINSREAAQRHAAAAENLRQEDQLQTTRDAIEKQMQAIPSAGGTYQIDWFAVMTGRTKHGLPVYDLGLVSPTPP